jgi:hypothetical protein
VPGATSLLELADVDLDRVRQSRALLIGAPDALGPVLGDLGQVIAAARAGGALVAVDVLHPGRPQDLERLAGLLAGAGPVDAAWLGIACGSLVATGLGSDAGIENLGQVLDFLSRAQPAVAGRIKEQIS